MSNNILIYWFIFSF